MLKSLHISNYILIDSLDLTFPEGLVIVTGQTGAGKSILIGALNLILGGKADASVIRAGAGSCVLEAEFELRGERERSSVDALGDVEWDGHSLVIRRVIYSSGRSRSFVNDAPVQLPLLAGLSSHLLDIHSQHQSLRLTDRAFQLSVLDLFAGNEGRLASHAELWRRKQTLVRELSELDARLSRLSEERAYNEAQYTQLAAAHLVSGEEVQLEAEHLQLANAEEIGQLLRAVEEQDSSTSEDGQGLSYALKESVRLLRRLGGYLAPAAALAERLETARIEVEDIFSEVSALGEGTDFSPERMSAVEERMSQLHELMRKHKCATVDELIAKRDSLSELLFDSSALQERRAALQEEANRVDEEIAASAAALRSARIEAAGPLSRRITEGLHFLEMGGAVFEVSVSETPMSSTGYDAVTFLFDAAGLRPADVAKCVSGGEISRIMLCLKAVMAEHTSMPAMVFDEIDSGVSGSVADKMGSMICDMGRHMQVIAITHLPQVAAKGDAHFLVSKSEDGTSSRVERLGKEGRVMEIARMLSGSAVTPAAVANARELLSAA